jgi:hypothetical protein
MQKIPFSDISAGKARFQGPGLINKFNGGQKIIWVEGKSEGGEGEEEGGAFLHHALPFPKRGRAPKLLQQDPPRPNTDLQAEYM